jgi:hypothetical protein
MRRLGNLARLVAAGLFLYFGVMFAVIGVMGGLDRLPRFVGTESQDDEGPHHFSSSPTVLAPWRSSASTSTTTSRSTTIP